MLQNSSSSYRTVTEPPPLEHRPFSDPSRLAPEDAQSPPKKHREHHVDGGADPSLPNGDISNSRLAANVRRRREKERQRSRSRRPTEWKKLLWIKQQCMITPSGYKDIHNGI